ncbi:MAG TPA: hypothetical protein VHB49_23920 [Bradyrhizobium sp.]|nr:hypothetical protein [Bradyrhizobium sp.]
MMTRLSISALLVMGLSQAAIAQGSIQQNEQNPPSTSAENMQTHQNIPRLLQQRLTSAGFTDVRIVPSSFVVTARDNSGHPVMMRITPNSTFFLTEVPAVSQSSTTGIDRGNPSETAQQNQPSAPAENQPSASAEDQQSASAENMQAPENLPPSLRQRLASDRFSDVNVVPRSALITARDRNGRPVMMRITPNSMFFLSEIPAASSTTTGMGRGNSNDSGESR